jgi:hypothetical protein
MTRKTRVAITLKVPRLTKQEKARLQKALRSVVSIMDAHDLKTVKLDGAILLTRQKSSRR